MLFTHLAALRQKHHPLHGLKKNKFFSTVIHPLLDVPFYTKLHDTRWRVRVRFMRHLSYIVNSRIVEPGVASLFLAINHCCRPRVFWDVGANFGYYSWLFLSADEGKTVVLFEPDSDNLQLIEATIRLNDLDGVHVIAAAVSDREGEAEFITDGISGFTGSLSGLGETFVSHHYDLEQRVTTVRTVTLDGEANRRPPPDLIKIDVEGAELHVVRGGAELFNDRQPMVIFESFEGLESDTSMTLSNFGYRIIGADSPFPRDQATSNYLALPPRFHDRADEILDHWQAIYGEWMGEPGTSE